MHPTDATLLKKWVPFMLGCVKRHENAVQHEHWLRRIYVLEAASLVIIIY